MKTFKKSIESQVSITELMLPSHSNFSGKIHGGYILNLMDQIAFACASKHSRSYCVTASVNKVDFLNPIEVGELVTLKASINYTGRTSMVVGLRVESENIQTGRSEERRAKSPDGKKNIPVPGLIIDTEQGIRRFARSIQRKNEAQSRSSRYDSNNFKYKEHIESLKTENIKIEIK